MYPQFIAAIGTTPAISFYDFTSLSPEKRLCAATPLPTRAYKVEKKTATPVTKTPQTPPRDSVDDPIENRPWFIHKIVKQALWRPLFALAWVPRTFQMHRSYTARYHANPNEDLFRGDPSRHIYDRTTRVGHAFERVLTPREYRKSDLTAQERDALRTSGATHGKIAAYIMTRANYVRITGNMIALGDNLWGQGGSKAEAVVMATDSAISASFIGVQTFYAKGFKNIEVAQKLVTQAGADAAAQEAARRAALGHQQDAYRLFRIGKTWSYGAFGLQTVGAGIKLFTELRKGSDAKLSAVVDSAVDVGQGAAYTSYNYYLIKEAGKIAQGAQGVTETAQAADAAKKATDVLSVSARVIPKPLLYTMRAFGIAGAAFGLYRGATSLHSGITDKKLPTKVRRQRIISGSLGVASSIAFGVGAFFITPAGLTIGTIALLVGLALVGIQTIYEEWPNIKRASKKAWRATANFARHTATSIVTSAIKAPAAIKASLSSACGSALNSTGRFFKKSWAKVFG